MKALVIAAQVGDDGPPGSVRPAPRLMRLSGGVRTRLHVNPLAAEHFVLPRAPAWADLVADASLPLHVDIGCCAGGFVLQRAQSLRGANHVGLDLQPRRLERARVWAAGVPNAGFLLANVLVPGAITTLLRDYPGPVVGATILFPDPFSQPRFRRRRLLQVCFPI